MKYCKKCGKQKTLGAFYISQKGKYHSYCKECKSIMAREWNNTNKEKRREAKERYKTLYPEKTRAAKERYRKTNRGQLSDSVSRRIRGMLKKEKNGRHWEDLVGYTVEQLKKHLEKLFKPGMTWDNYGTYWHIDHKVPIAVFNYEKPEDIDFKICWSIKNLQPLEAKKNIGKCAKIEKPYQPSLLLEAVG